jgi:hypothetical protein
MTILSQNADIGKLNADIVILRCDIEILQKLLKKGK